MDLEHRHRREATKESNVSEETPSKKAKSSLRILYEAEVAAIQKKYGSLNQIRKDLGLSQRQFCKMMLVDPSTWNRWQRAENGAPPVVWRSISWFLLLKEKDPWLSRYFSDIGREGLGEIKNSLELERTERVLSIGELHQEKSQMDASIEALKRNIENKEHEIADLRREMRKMRTTLLIFLGLALVGGIGSFFIG